MLRGTAPSGITKIPCLSGFLGLYKAVSPTRVAPYRLSIPWPAPLSLSVTSFSLLQLSLPYTHAAVPRPYASELRPSLHSCPLQWARNEYVAIFCDIISELLLSCVILSVSFGSTLYQYSRTLNRHLVPSTRPHFHCRLCLLVVP